MLSSFPHSTQVSNATLSAADFAMLGECRCLQHLWLRFSYLPDNAAAATPSGSGSGAGSNPVAADPATSTSAHCRAIVAAAQQPWPLDYIPGRAARRASDAPDGPAAGTRARKSLGSTGGPAAAGAAAGGAAGAAAAAPARRRSSSAAGAALGAGGQDCSESVAPYVLRPLLQLRMLESLEVVEEPAPPPEQPVLPSLPPEQPRARGRPLRAAGSAAALPPPPSSAAAAGSSRQQQRPAAAAVQLPPSLPAAQQPQRMPLSRAGLRHFLSQLNKMDELRGTGGALSLTLLSEEAALPDCPCAGRQCLNGEGRRRRRPPPLEPEAIVGLLSAVGCCRVALGEQVVTGPDWRRPSAWPTME